MRVTQQDIAKMAGVSQATVSRVLAGDARVEPEIRTKVLGVIQDQNYRPDVRAQALRQQHTHLIGLVLRREARDLAGDPFFSVFVSEIIAYLASTPYHLCVDVADATKQATVYEDMLRTRRVDGVILVESEPKDERIKRLSRDRFPFVVIGNPQSDSILSVDNDNVFAATMATRHLIEQGYKNVGFICGPNSLTVCQERSKGYEIAVREAGMRPRIWNADFGIDSARNAGRDALLHRERPDALLIMDDYMAMGVVQAAREIGLCLPNELGLVSFNDTNLCDVLENGLTSVSLNLREMVKVSIQKLLTAIEDGEGAFQARTLVPCRLEVRGSSQPDVEGPKS
jgi:DNA-binding LacI/PurR family transcriptional regulator